MVASPICTIRLMTWKKSFTFATFNVLTSSVIFSCDQNLFVFSKTPCADFGQCFLVFFCLHTSTWVTFPITFYVFIAEKTQSILEHIAILEILVMMRRTRTVRVPRKSAGLFLTIIITLEELKIYLSSVLKVYLSNCLLLKIL